MPAEDIKEDFTNGFRQIEMTKESNQIKSEIQISH